MPVLYHNPPPHPALHCGHRIKTVSVDPEGKRLPQTNLALLFGEKSNLPFSYRKRPGNTPDVKTICNLLKEKRGNPGNKLFDKFTDASRDLAIKI